MFKLLKKLALVGLLVCLAASTASADMTNLVKNGSFETGQAPGYFLVLSTGSTAITDWQVVSGSIDYIGTCWTAAEGSRSIDLSGGSYGALAIATALDTEAGKTYRLSFAMAGNPVGDPSTKSLTVTVAGISQDFTFDTTGKSVTNMGWTTKELVFTATGSTSLKFASNVSTCYGPALDDVKVVEVVPAPAAAMLGMLGLGLIGWVKRRMA